MPKRKTDTQSPPGGLEQPRRRARKAKATAVEPTDAPTAPKRPRGRPPKDPAKGAQTEAERAKRARERRRREQEAVLERSQRLARWFASAMLYLADKDPEAARWVLTPLAPLPESAQMDAIAAQSFAEQLAWTVSQLVTEKERELFRQFAAAIADGTYSKNRELRTAMDSAWGFRRTYEKGQAKVAPKPRDGQ